jgi:hypothetical protein
MRSLKVKSRRRIKGKKEIQTGYGYG